jgi:hypothetical protein
VEEVVAQLQVGDVVEVTRRETVKFVAADNDAVATHTGQVRWSNGTVVDEIVAVRFLAHPSYQVGSVVRVKESSVVGEVLYVNRAGRLLVQYDEDHAFFHDEDDVELV